MKNVFDELRKVGIFFLSTVDGDKPCVRPFGAVCLYEDNLYICTNNKKDVYKQMIKNPNVEIAAMYVGRGENWLRIKGKVVRDKRIEVKKAMLDSNPGLTQLYSTDDGIFEVFKLDVESCVKNSVMGEVETII